MYLVPEFPSKPHYAFCMELHRSPRVVTEPMLILPRPLPMEEFKARWRTSNASEQSNLVNQARQLAKNMLAKQKLKTGVAILGFPLKEVLEDPLIQLRKNESIINGESLALSCLTAELTVLLGADIKWNHRHKYIGRGQYPKVLKNKCCARTKTPDM